jgi:hypothetical protein
MPLLPQNSRNEIGKQVAALYREQNGEMPEKKVLIDEPEQKFFVQWYPTEFIPEIDKVIKDFMKVANVGNNVPRIPCETIEYPDDLKQVLNAPKKRKRMPVGKIPVVSQKLNLVK